MKSKEEIETILCLKYGNSVSIGLIIYMQNGGWARHLLYPKFERCEEYGMYVLCDDIRSIVSVYLQIINVGRRIYRSTEKSLRPGTPTYKQAILYGRVPTIALAILERERGRK